MTIDEAVRRKIEQILIEKKLCDESKVTTIAEDAAKNIYELFNGEVTALKDELHKQGERQDRLWDQIFRVQEIKKRSFWGRLAFWRRNAN